MALHTSVLLAGLVGLAPVLTAASSPEFFESRIRPVLDANCLGCHSKLAMAGLRLDSRAAMLKGGVTGPAVVPGDPEKSLLIQAIRQERPELQMPKGGKLKKREIDDFVEWVKAGAAWPEARMSAPSGPGLSAQKRGFFNG
jgi:mono/diheme cytochrome c family protein